MLSAIQPCLKCLIVNVIELVSAPHHIIYAHSHPTSPFNGTKYCDMIFFIKCKKYHLFDIYIYIHLALFYLLLGLRFIDLFQCTLDWKSLAFEDDFFLAKLYIFCYLSNLPHFAKTTCKITRSTYQRRLTREIFLGDALVTKYFVLFATGFSWSKGAWQRCVLCVVILVSLLVT